MAQGKVTDFFSTRKRNPALQPSKRRKVEIVATNVDVSTLDKTNTNYFKNLAQEAEASVSEADQSKNENKIFSPLQTRAGRKAKSVKVASTAKKTTRARKTIKADPGQKLLSDTFSAPEVEKEPKQAAPKAVEATVLDDVTSSWDDHDGPPATPSKAEETTKTRKRTRQPKTSKKEETSDQSDEATPEKLPAPVRKAATKGRAKKKLQMTSSTIDESKTIVDPPKELQFSPPEMTKPEESVPATKGPSAVAAALEKCKALKTNTKTGKVSAEDIKAKLSKVGNLDDLKKRLAQMKEAREKIKTPAPSIKKFKEIQIEVETPSEVKHKVPAYERFHHLATAAAPTLTLPYKYRLLAEHFRGMDQVISMLHNRSELCTFSKLKVAVQELTKRNFEEKHVGQIKTVYPEAYELRQEKNLPNLQGFKNPGYQLTVEARLEDSEDKKGPRTMFKASHLLNRRNYFHNSLISIVKKHHKNYLANLSRPLTIPDDKITRWHPKFPLDEVPDIELSPLPQPPDLPVYQTARDVLDSTRGKLTPKVEAALQATANAVRKAEPPASTPSKAPVTPNKTSASTPSSTVVKGIPQSLLEKIRAKEAANTAAALTRDPKSEKRLVMLQRLPDVMRIIRSHFVTEKKPALPVDTVIQRVFDSYKSCIAFGDVEPHINLCIEVVPEWLSIVQIKKGRYLKIDRNIDLQKLTDKVLNLAKGKK